MPPYLKLIVDNADRRVSGSSASKAAPKLTAGRSASAEVLGAAAGYGEFVSSSNVGDLVSLVSKENQRANSTSVPTAFEAARALSELERDLPGLGQAVGELHQFPDRGRILVLLAPLVE